MEHSSIVDIPEGQLVKELLADPYWQPTLFDLAGFPENPIIRDQVDLAGVPGGFVGGVDVRLCDQARPDLAVAIQAKRIKFDAWDLERGSACMRRARRRCAHSHALGSTN
jgi:hypothetical protein